MSRVTSPLDYHIRRLEFSTRLYNALLARNLTHAHHLYGIDLNNMARWRGVGKASVDELRAWLADNPDPRPAAEKPAVALPECAVFDCDNKCLVWSEYCEMHEDTNVINPDQWEGPQVSETPDFVSTMQGYRETVINALSDSARDVDAARETRDWAIRLEALDDCIDMAKQCGVWG